jgi:hypothetical protein
MRANENRRRTTRLLPQHREQLTASAISGEVAKARGYRSAPSSGGELRRIGFSEAQSKRVPGLLIPIWDVYGENRRYQLRPDEPAPDESGKPRKYENLPNVGVTLDINPLSLDDVTKKWREPLWVTEGVKKGDALVSAGAAAVALYSVWSWRGTDESGAISRLPVWDEIPLKGKRGGAVHGRVVYIVFDSDVMRKRSVQLALERIGRFLGGRGAEVWYVYLTPGPDDAKVGIDDYLASGGSLTRLKKLAKREPEGLTEIQTNHRQLREITQEVIEVLDRSNDPELMFRWGSVLARVRVDERGQPLTDPYNQDSMLHHMSMVADFFSARLDKGMFVLNPVYPPKAVAQNVLATPTWPFPILEGVVETPTIRPDGSILDHPGFDRRTGLMYVPDPDFEMAPVPDEPSAEDVEKALARLLYLVHDFPFVEDADLTNFFALLLTPVLRPAIHGPVLLCGLDAPQQGSGKTLLAELLSRITTGRPAEVRVAPKTEEEWDKTILAALLPTPALTIFDNVMGVLNSGTLAAATTSSTFSGRILGVTKNATIPVRTTWVMTGNNLKFGGDLPRRVYVVHINPKMAKPWLRKQDDYLQSNLEEWSLEHRGKLLWSLLVLARAWWAAGCPRPPDGAVPILGKFEAWSNVVGGVLYHAGTSSYKGRTFRGKPSSGTWMRPTRRWTSSPSSGDRSSLLGSTGSGASRCGRETFRRS